MAFLELLSKNTEKSERKTDAISTLHFSFALIGLEKLMDREFSCPCTPGLNAILVGFIFLGPALLALTMMMFLRRPCRHSSSQCARLFLFSLIPPSLWVFLLLFEGDYVACGLMYWEGDYVFDEDLQIKWCKPTQDIGMNGTDLRELSEKVIFFSKFSALVLLTLLAAIVITAVSCWDCRTRCVERQEKPVEPKESSIYGSEVELQNTF